MNLQQIKRTLDLPAFRSRNYRLFFMGQGLSLVGTWMTQIATIWTVYALNASPFLLGVVGFASQIPSLVLVPFGGILGDRWNRHHILLVTQVLSMVQSLTLAALTLTHTIQIWHIILLALFQGVVNAFDAPTRQAFVPELLENKALLPNAIALNSSVFNGARLVGPAIAGVVIAVVGAGYCFLLDGLSYIAVLSALLVMKLKPRSFKPQAPVSVGQITQQLQDGWQYVAQFTPIRDVLLLMALTSFMGMPYTVLLPIFADKVLQGGADTLGVLTAASGIGALIAGVSLSLRKSIRGLGKQIAIAPALMGIGLVVFALSKALWLSTLMLVLVGFGFLSQFASSNTIIQTVVEDDKRGRVMSLYIMAFMGMMPLGSLLAGSLANWLGAPFTVALGGGFCILGAIVFTQKLPRIRRILRPIYQNLGIV